ncbi:MAG: GWxTD domain-containing protein [Saprospiraceae bacterium]
MKKIFTFILPILIFGFTNARLVAMDVSVNTYRYQDNGTHFVDVYLYFLGNTVNFLPDSIDQNLKSANVMITTLINDDSKVANYAKYILTSNKVKLPIDFYDVKRYKLLPGNYNLEITIYDLEDSTNYFSYQERLEIIEENLKVITSDIQLLSEKKATLDIKNDLPFNYYGDDQNLLNSYFEIYNSTVITTDIYFAKYAIFKDYYLRDSVQEEVLKKYERFTPSPNQKAGVILDINRLPTGNYHFMVEIYDKNKVLQCFSTVNFYRSNTRLELEKLEKNFTELKDNYFWQIPADSLNYMLKAHIPIINNNSINAVNMIIKDSLELPKRAFLFQYWNEVRKKQAVHQFKEYMKVAEAVDKEFYETVGYGFQSDRGYIFLKYGKPNKTILIEDDPIAPPYEIWFYSYLPFTKQTDVRFIFYSPSKVNNKFELLHSTCRGEINNPQWELKLYSNAPEDHIGVGVDATGVKDNFNRMAKRIFDQF